MSLDRVAVKIINLPYREDRKVQAIQELKKVGINKYSFSYAKHIPELGAKGCSLSHAKTLSDYMFYDEEEFVLVFEDDFEVEEEVDLIQVINSVIDRAHLWDVFLFNHAFSTPFQGSNEFERVGERIANRVSGALHQAAYLVKRSYVPKLIKNFFDSSELLTVYSFLPEQNKKPFKEQVCGDVLWTHLQLFDQWWAYFPQCVAQRESYSDIENRNAERK